MIDYRIRFIGEGRTKKLNNIFAIDGAHCDEDIRGWKLDIWCRFDTYHFSRSQFNQISRKLRIKLIILNSWIYRGFKDRENN